MAIGNMEASPFVAYVEQQPRFSSQKKRAMIVAGVLCTAMCASVLLMGTESSPTELIAASAGVNLASSLIRSAEYSDVKQMTAILKEWQRDQIVNFGDDKVAQMLASVPANIESVLAESGKLCEKKDIIFAKFDQLLKKLGDENVVRNATDQAAYDAKQTALKAWLDGESAYRLEKEKVKEAKEGAKFARSQYEKWAETVKSTKARVAKMKTDYSKELEDIKLERDLIKEILRLLGIMEDQPLDAASKKAGGYMKDGAAERANPMTLKEVRAKISMLKKQAERGGPIQLSQVNTLQSKLASFAETDEVKKLLFAMLGDLKTREDTISKALSTSEAELKDHEEKLVKYEKQVVDLSNAADKAKQRADSKDLQRQKLNGDKITTGEAYTTEHAEYVIVAPPADRAIFIIKQIKIKINAFCTKA